MNILYNPLSYIYFQGMVINVHDTCTGRIMQSGTFITATHYTALYMSNERNLCIFLESLIHLFYMHHQRLHTFKPLI